MGRCIASTTEAIIVGDGYVDKKGRIGISHGIAQKDYLLWKADLLRDDGFKVSIWEREVPHFRDRSIKLAAICLLTSATFRGKELRERFYWQGSKQVPAGIDLNWQEWAIIYQDDGRANKCAHYNILKEGNRVRVDCPSFVNMYEICVPSFSNESVERLITSLRWLSVEARSFVRNDGQRNIKINKVEPKAAFRDGVMDYIHPVMQYKINLPTSLRLANASAR